MTFLYRIVAFTFILAFILGFYGIATGSPDIQNTMNQIMGRKPININFDPLHPSAGNLGDWIAYPFIIIVAALFKLGAVFFLFYNIFALLNSVSGETPFLGWFFGLLLFVLAVESFLVFRSGKLSA